MALNTRSSSSAVRRGSPPNLRSAYPRSRSNTSFHNSIGKSVGSSFNFCNQIVVSPTSISRKWSSTKVPFNWEATLKMPNTFRYIVNHARSPLHQSVGIDCRFRIQHVSLIHWDRSGAQAIQLRMQSLLDRHSNTNAGQPRVNPRL